MNKKCCKGQGKANSFDGCGKLVYRFRYGLCKKCYTSFLLTTDEGKAIINKAKIKAKTGAKKIIKERRKKIKQKLKGHSYYTQILQKEFNLYIRLRDADKQCISCDVYPEWNNSNASHYYAVGKAPQLRFNEDNVHKSCIRCNKWLHGNLEKYTERLPKRIGKERFEKLIKDQQTELKLSIPELKEKIEHYRNLNKKLKSEKS